MKSVNPPSVSVHRLHGKMIKKGKGSLEITYPEDDSVLSLKYRDELISPDNFGLVQRTKSTQHLDIAFRVSISHCAEELIVDALPKDSLKKDFFK